MTSNNYKQKATEHVTSLANGHFTGSDASFMCEILTATSNKKRYNFADTGLAVGMPADFAPTKACLKRSRWQTAQNRPLHQTGRTCYQSCM